MAALTSPQWGGTEGGTIFKSLGVLNCYSEKPLFIPVIKV